MELVDFLDAMFEIEESFRELKKYFPGSEVMELRFKEKVCYDCFGQPARNRYSIVLESRGGVITERYQRFEG